MCQFLEADERIIRPLVNGLACLILCTASTKNKSPYFRASPHTIKSRRRSLYGKYELPKPWIGPTPIFIGFSRKVEAFPSCQKMLGVHKGYDTRDFVADLRISGISPHDVQKIQARCSSLIVDRTARHQCYSQPINTKKRIEQMFGWIKQAAGLRKPKTRGRSKLVRNFETRWQPLNDMERMQWSAAAKKGLLCMPLKTLRLIEDGRSPEAIAEQAVRVDWPTGV